VSQTLNSERNGWLSPDHWLTDDEKQAINKFHFAHQHRSADG
jgi:hypothetical protein